MTRQWQLLLLAGALLAPTGAWADKKDGDKQSRERSEQQDRDWNDNDRGRNRGAGVWDPVTGRTYPRNTGSEKEARKDQKERAKDQREGLKEREKDRREAVRESDKDRREAVRESEKDRAEAARNGGRNSDYPRTKTRASDTSYRDGNYRSTTRRANAESPPRQKRSVGKSAAIVGGSAGAGKGAALGAAIGGTSGVIYDQQTRTKRRRH